MQSGRADALSYWSALVTGLVLAVIPAIAGIVAAICGLIRFRCLLNFLKDRDPAKGSLSDVAEVIRAYRSGPFGELLEGLAKIFRRGG